MDSLAKDFAGTLLHDPEPPCLSLYQPTHRSHPDNAQDPIRFQNLVKQLEASLAQKYPSREIGPMLDPFHRLASDYDFWQHTLEGLAVLCAPGMFRVYRLQRSMPELAIVADSFHLKPLYRTLQSADGYQVLSFSRDSAELFQGNRYALDPVQEPHADLPRTSADVPSADADSRYAEHDRSRSGRGGDGSVRTPYTPRSRTDVNDDESGKFFRALDEAVLEHHSRPSGQPLLLAALPENESLFRKHSRNPHLLPEGIGAAAETMPIDELRQRAWALIEPAYLAKLAAHVDAFGAAQAREQASGDLSQAAKSAVEGRVATLLVEAERRIPGRIDAQTGAIEHDKLSNPEIDDMLDDLAELVHKNGGEVVVVPAERMPTQSGLAAIYRY